MVTGPLVLAAVWTTISRTSSAAPCFIATRSSLPHRAAPHNSFSVNRSVLISPSLSQQRLLASASSEPPTSARKNSSVSTNVSRLATLQTLLSKHGAPGSIGCRNGKNDLVPIAASWSIQDTTPELITTLEGTKRSAPISEEDMDKFCNLHPYLVPIAQSQATGNIVCAYRNPMTEESDKNHPWPIVESKVGAPGFQLLALNSEHLMRRIACECDGNVSKNDSTAVGASDENETDSQFIIQLYNEGLGQGLLRDSKLDTPYQTGSVDQLGYGVDKYVLLRVGPFPDLYEQMARNHFSKGDEQSALIAAEASNGKLSGFGSTFRFYARLLSSFKNRDEECRDSARMCLRLPLSTIGLDYSNFEEVAMLGQMGVDESSTQEEAIDKMKHFYDLIRSVERDSDDDSKSSGKTQNQVAIEEATFILDQAVLDKKEWNNVRSELAEHFRSAGKEELANFVSLFKR